MREQPHFIAAFCVLTVEATGEIVPAKLVDGKYGHVWLVTDPDYEARFGRTFIPSDSSHVAPSPYPHDRSRSRSKVQKDLGLIQGFELALARETTWRVPTGYWQMTYEHIRVIVRVDPVEYGAKTGVTWFDADDRLTNPELLEVTQ